MKLPDVVGLLLCKRMEVDPHAGETSLIGLLHTFRFIDFPSPPQPFTVYSALHDGVGEGTIELVITRLETEEDFYRYRRWLALPGRGSMVHLEIRVRKCVFPAPGRYSAALFFDGHELSRRPIIAKRKKDRS